LSKVEVKGTGLDLLPVPVVDSLSASFTLYNISMYSAQYGGRSGRAKGKTPKGDKCSICEKKGHVEADCPKRDDPKFKLKAKTGAGSGFTHKTSRKAGSDKKKNGSSGDDGNGNETALTPVFEIKDVDAQNSPFFCFDAGCDVGESIDSLATLQGSSKRAMSAYQAALNGSKDLYGGCICRQLLKPGRPWNADAVRTKMMLEADPHTFFVVGLGPGFLMSKSGADADMDDEDASEDDDDDDDLEEAVDALMEAIEVDDRVVGFYAKLEYAPEVLEFPGFDRQTQLRRFRATCTAAIQSNVPVQCRVLPGAADKDDVDAHKLVMKDLAKVLVEMTPESESSNSLKVHLVCWNGTSENLMKILKAFPTNVYVGMNAAVGFAKASVAHECAFDVPLDRLLLETDSPNTIPATVVAGMGRKAYCHSGHVPIVAAAIAEHKKNSGYSAIDVARMASNNTAAL
jgi:Tat protein secretion system quality control protein TatD with DNase activity